MNDPDEFDSDFPTDDLELCWTRLASETRRVHHDLIGVVERFARLTHLSDRKEPLSANEDATAAWDLISELVRNVETGEM